MRRLIIFVLCILLGGCAGAESVKSDTTEAAPATVAPSSTTTSTSTTVPPTTSVASTTSTLVPETTTTTLVDRAAPMELRIASMETETPIIPTGPRYEVNRWYPEWGTVELYGTDQMVDPGEIGGAFVLGHSNVHKNFGPDVFFNLIDDERYDTDYGVDVGDEVEVVLVDGLVCRFRVINLHEVDAPGETLELSPGRYFPKFEKWGTGDPGDERIALTELALKANVARLYLMGSYAGPDGNELVTTDSGSRHQAYTAYIAADLEDCIPEEGS